MLIVFFDMKGVIMTECVPRGQTVNQYYCLQVLTTLRDRVRRKRPESRGKTTVGSCIKTMRRLIMSYLLSSFWPKIERRCYTSFPLFVTFRFMRLLAISKIKKRIKGGTHFESVEAVKTKSTEVIKAL